MNMTKAEIDSPLWKKLRAYFEEKLQRHRELNDNSTLNDLETARLRGRIAEIKDVLVLDRPAAQTPGHI